MDSDPETLKSVIEDLLSTIADKDTTIDKATKIIADLKHDFESVLHQLRECQAEKETALRTRERVPPNPTNELQTRRYEERLQRMAEQSATREKKLQHQEVILNKEKQMLQARVAELQDELCRQVQNSKELTHQYKVKETGFTNAFQLIQEYEQQLKEVQHSVQLQMADTIVQTKQEKRNAEAHFKEELETVKHLLHRHNPPTQVVPALDLKVPLYKQQLVTQLDREEELVHFLRSTQLNWQYLLKLVDKKNQPIVPPEFESLKMKCNELETRLSDAQVRDHNLSVVLQDMTFAYNNLKAQNTQLKQILQMVASSNCTPLADIDFNNDELVEVGEILNILKAYIANLVEEKAISKSTFDNEIRELKDVINTLENERHECLTMLNSQQQSLPEAIKTLVMQVQTLTKEVEVKTTEAKKQALELEELRNSYQNISITDDHNNQSMVLLERTLEDLESLQLEREQLNIELSKLRRKHHALETEYREMGVKLSQADEILGNLASDFEGGNFFRSFRKFCTYLIHHCGSRPINQVIEGFELRSALLSDIAVRLLELQQQKEQESGVRLQRLVAVQKEQYQHYIKGSSDPASTNTRVFRDQQTALCQTVIHTLKMQKEQMIAMSELFYELGASSPNDYHEGITRCLQVIERAHCIVI